MRNCEHCGEPLPKGSRRDKRYCNRRCGENGRRAAKRRAAGVPQDRQQRTCPVCGIDFTTRRSTQQYCGKPCQWFALNQRRIAKRRKSDRCNLPSVALILRRAEAVRSKWQACIVCGDKFRPKGGTQKTCSPQCSQVRELYVRRERERQQRTEARKAQHESLTSPRIDCRSLRG